MNQGYYQCTASNQYGKALSVVTYLQQVGKSVNKPAVIVQVIVRVTGRVAI